ncbi:phosphodiester glycosidase family protein [Paenibacillus sp. CAU 1782]
MIAHKRIRIQSGRVEEGALTYSLTGANSKGQGWSDIRIASLPPDAIIRTELVTAKGKTVSAILAQQVARHGGEWLCFNASFVSQDGTLLGLTHNTGQTLFPDVKSKTEHRPHFYRKGGKFGIGRQQSPTGLDWAVSAVPSLAENGRPIVTPTVAEQTPADLIASNPRMIAGIKDDGTLCLIMGDGRGSYDKGLTLSESAQLAVYYGCQRAVNLDGGGSATLATNNAQLRELLDIDKANRKRSYHVADMSLNHTERIVHHAIAIQFDPNILFPRYVINHIPATTPNNRRSGRALKATTLTIHNTGNPSSTAPNERTWLTNPSNGVTASYHIVIGPKTTEPNSPVVAIECLPLNEVGWHAGDGTKASGGNMTSIGIEICESGDYGATVAFAVQLVADMLRARGWGVDRLRRHWDWPSSLGYRKVCPRLMYDGGEWTGWITFKKRVQQALDKGPSDQGNSGNSNSGGGGNSAGGDSGNSDSSEGGKGSNESENPSQQPSPSDGQPQEIPKTAYRDVPAGYWAEDAIHSVTEAGIMQGYPDGSFRPGMPVTRAELATILRRQLEQGDLGATTESP